MRQSHHTVNWNHESVLSEALTCQYSFSPSKMVSLRNSELCCSKCRGKLYNEAQYERKYNRKKNLTKWCHKTRGSMISQPRWFRPRFVHQMQTEVQRSCFCVEQRVKPWAAFPCSLPVDLCIPNITHIQVKTLWCAGGSVLLLFMNLTHLYSTHTHTHTHRGACIGLWLSAATSSWGWHHTTHRDSSKTEKLKNVKSSGCLWEICALDGRQK